MLASVLSDTDTALEFGFRGGQLALAKLLTCVSDEDMLDAVGTAVEACAAALPPGLSFPMQTALEGHFPLAPISLELAPLLPRLSDAMNGLAVLARIVPSTLHKQRSQEDVGQVLWPAAPVLGRWLARQPRLVRGKAILEIGAGMGLTGFAAGLVGLASELEAGATPACLPSAAASGAPETAAADATVFAPRTRVTLTDFQPVVLHNLAYNARLNEPGASCNHPSLALLRQLTQDASEGALASGSGQPPQSTHLPPLFSVRKLDWSVYAPPDLLARSAEYKRRRLARFAGVAAEHGAAALCGGGGGSAAERAASPALSVATAGSVSSSGFSAPCSPVGGSRCSTPTQTTRSWTQEGSSGDVDDGEAPAAAAADAAAVVEVAQQEEEGEEGEDDGVLSPSAAFDVVLGTDMICCVEDAFCVAHTLARHMRRPGAGAGGAAAEGADAGGVAYLLLPPPEVRWGMEAVAEALHSVGLEFSVQPVPLDCLEANPDAPDADAAAVPPLCRYAPPAPAEDDGAHVGSNVKAAAMPDVKRHGGAELVVAGGYERRLRLFTVTWGARV